MDIILIGGLWLDGASWSQVARDLDKRGHRPVPLTLPGQGDGNGAATLADQVEAVSAAVRACDSPPLVVGHSAAATLAWVAADRHPDYVHAVALIGGMPVSDGEAYADFFPMVDGAMPFPGWEPFQGPDAADLDESARAALAAGAIPVPAGVAQGVITLSSEARFGVPTTLLCPEFSPEEAREWMDAGGMPELARARQLSMVDIDSGHWPMVTAPTELARILDQITKEA